MTWLDWARLASVVTNVLVIWCFVDDRIRKRSPPWTELDQLHKFASLQQKLNEQVEEELDRLGKRIVASPYRGATPSRRVGEP